MLITIGELKMINNKIIYTGHKYTEIITKPSDQGTMRIYTFGNGIFVEIKIAMGIAPIATSLRVPATAADNLMVAVIKDDYEYVDNFLIVNRPYWDRKEGSDNIYELMLHLSGAPYVVGADQAYDYRRRYEEYIDVIYKQYLSDFHLTDNDYHHMDQWCRSFCAQMGTNLNRIESLYNLIRECGLAYERIAQASRYLNQTVKCIPFTDIMEYRHNDEYQQFYKVPSVISKQVKELIFNREDKLYNIFTTIEPYFINADVEMNKLDIEYFLRGCGIGLEVLDD